MRTIFDDTEERVFFSRYLADNINKAIDKITEEIAIEPVIDITPNMIEIAIKEYEKG